VPPAWEVIAWVPQNLLDLFLANVVRLDVRLAGLGVNEEADLHLKILLCSKASAIL
jgi:hypothetical protein